jgi:hypothetical protein
MHQLYEAKILRIREDWILEERMTGGFVPDENGILKKYRTKVI